MRQNQIRTLDVNGSTLTAHDDKVKALTDHFTSILGAVQPTTWNFDLSSLYNGYPTACADELTAPFTNTEAKATIHAMNKASTPGPDGFGPSFYQAAWPELEQKLMTFHHSFHDNTADLERINRSYIVLLPKRPGANIADTFRPISLQNCSIKIPSKLLTTRL